MQLDSVEKFYKYSDVAGARFILRDGNLKFSLASTYNDPFDAKIDTLFAYDPIATLQELREEKAKILFSDETYPPFAKGQIPQLTAWMRQSLAGKTPEEKKYLKELILADSPESIWNIERLQTIDRETLATVKFFFAMDAIFCASLIYDNHLLWSHYSEDHKGVALEFVANVEKDSLLRLMTRVRYSAERPVYYKSPKDFIYKSMFRENQDVLEEYMQAISLTKNPRWEHEQEVRAYIPLYILGGKPYRLQNYHGDELRAIYLGCKTTPEVEKELVMLAHARNPAVKVFKMTMGTANYNLTPIEVDIRNFL